MTEPFRSRSFSQRLGTMGDIAENAFLEEHPKAHRLGLNRPEFSMSGMPANMRYAPDFMTRHAAYEVMGFSSRTDSTLKVKFDKLDALTRWAVLMPINLWIYDSSKKIFWDAPLPEWAAAMWARGEPRSFDEGKRFWALKVDDFPKMASSLDVAA